MLPSAFTVYPRDSIGPISAQLGRYASHARATEAVEDDLTGLLYNGGCTRMMACVELLVVAVSVVYRVTLAFGNVIANGSRA